MGNVISTLSGPIGPPRGSKLIAIASLPHYKEHEREDHEIWIDKDGLIHWHGGRPDEAWLKSNDQLRWTDSDGVRHSSALTRGAGNMPDIKIAAADRVSGQYPAVLTEAVGEGYVHVDTSGNMTWDGGARPTTRYRIANTFLADLSGTRHGPITWAASPSDLEVPGDTTTAAAANSPRVFAYELEDDGTLDGLNVTIAAATGVCTFQDTNGNNVNDTIDNHLKVGDGFKIADNSQIWNVSAVNTTTHVITVDNHGGNQHTQAGSLKLYRKGKAFIGYEILLEGFILEDWEIWVTGNYYGEGGTPDSPAPFFVEAVDLGSETSKQVLVTDATNNQHVFVPANAGDVFKRIGMPCLVNSVRHGTNITSFYAVFL